MEHSPCEGRPDLEQLLVRFATTYSMAIELPICELHLAKYRFEQIHKSGKWSPLNSKSPEP
ncbi:hypothetical protein Scep_004350 [Stephania cephalantha]|uniref:Uncharacterized protein n=1 Tax=Stephania cephalantha TaxID=152367 RepID=A0AAP0KSB4_9MAGN